MSYGSREIYQYVTAEPPGPYATTNQMILESVKPRDLIICAIENPVNVIQRGMILRNAKGQDNISIILFDERGVATTILGNVKYDSYNDCKISIVKNF